MTKFNRPIPARGVISTEAVSSGTTHEGAHGFARDVKSELFLLGVSNFVGEATFYETAEKRDERFAALVRDVAISDVEWLVNFIRWLRSDSNLRSAPIMAAAEAVKARLDAGKAGKNRALITAALQRADEPGEFLAYWISHWGDKLPMPVKRGVADAIRKLYNEYAFIKYEPDNGLRFSNVIQLVHPTPLDSRQNSLFKYILDTRYSGEPEMILGLPILDRNRNLRNLPTGQRRGALLENPDLFLGSGFTWEQVSGWIQGEMTGEVWDAIIPSMGYMALLRNLRNFEQAGISPESVRYVQDYLTDPEKVARSRQFPFRFVSARSNVYGYTYLNSLETALDLSLSNVPRLTGRSLILVDRSGSMFGRNSGNSNMDAATMAAVFGTALAKRADSADLIQYGNGWSQVVFGKSIPILETVNQFSNLGGTQTALAVQATYRNHNRVILLTDEQAWYYGKTPGQVLPPTIPLYTWNFVGYQHGHTAGDTNRYTFGGMTDSSFKTIPLLEKHRNGMWPWE